MTNTTIQTETTTEIDAEAAANIALQRSVVAPTYKRKYAERAISGAKYRKTISKKARSRMNGDWLAQELAERTLDEKDHLRVEDFLSLLDANGVDHSRWTNRSKGWEGRLRMTGRLALQRAVAAEEALFLPDGSTVTPPRAWIEKHQH